MKEENHKDRVQSLIEESNNIAIIPSKVAGADAFCASVALYYMLKEQEKNVTLIYPGKQPKDTEGIIKDELVTKDIGDRSLVVSIDYADTDASKVHYNTDDGVLTLKIQPIPADFEKDLRVTAKITGYDFDLIFGVGAQSIEDLGSSYEMLDSNSKLSRIVNIDNSGANERFGFINAIEHDAASLSLLVLQRAPRWGIKPSERAAKAILKGITLKEPQHRD